jgi:transposase
MEERLRFVARLLEGEPMTDMCREFGISRKTGYKIFDRYKEHGLEAVAAVCRARRFRTIGEGSLGVPARPRAGGSLGGPYYRIHLI